MLALIHTKRLQFNLESWLNAKEIAVRKEFTKSVANKFFLTWKQMFAFGVQNKGYYESSTQRNAFHLWKECMDLLFDKVNDI